MFAVRCTSVFVITTTGTNITTLTYIPVKDGCCSQCCGPGATFGVSAAPCKSRARTLPKSSYTLLDRLLSSIQSRTSPVRYTHPCHRHSQVQQNCPSKTGIVLSTHNVSRHRSHPPKVYSTALWFMLVRTNVTYIWLPLPLPTPQPYPKTLPATSKCIQPGPNNTTRHPSPKAHESIPPVLVTAAAARQQCGVQAGMAVCAAFCCCLRLPQHAVTTAWQMLTLPASSAVQRRGCP